MSQKITDNKQGCRIGVPWGLCFGPGHVPGTIPRMYTETSTMRFGQCTVLDGRATSSIIMPLCLLVHYCTPFVRRI